MIFTNYRVRYRFFDNSIILPVKVNSSIIVLFASAINEWLRRQRYNPLTLNFTYVQKAYSNGMLPIISTVCSLRAEGYTINIRMPESPEIFILFKQTNWAYFLLPHSFKIQTSYDRQLLTRRFNDYKDVPAITNDFMNIVIRSISIPKDTLTALEWSMYEVCDNVINHSESKVGGFVEAVTYSKEGVISFTVSDSGRGILASLREGIPTLKNSIEAIGEAIKEGVTRNKAAGQGNGLAGSLRVTDLSGGSLDITTGAGRFFFASGQANKSEGNSTQFFKGTSVSGQISMYKKFSIGKALFFNGKEYDDSENIIDSHYEMDDEDSLLIKLKKETTGVGTRKAGKQFNTFVLNLIDAKPDYPIYVDWEGIPVISSSFADEFIGKLYTEIGKEYFDKTIRNINMESIVNQLLNKAISQRITQENS